MVKKYRKLPVEIEAFELKAPVDDAALTKWSDGKVVKAPMGATSPMGEFYPCQPEIFAKTYEEVAG